MKQQLAAGLSEGQVAEFVENERSPTQDHRCPDHLCLKVTASAEDGTAACRRAKPGILVTFRQR